MRDPVLAHPAQGDAVTERQPFPTRPALVAAALILVLGMAAPGIAYAVFGPPEDGGFRTPPIFPPGWMFWAVWILLYPTMGIATGYVWRERGRDRFVDVALAIFALHLAINIAWVPVVQASGRPLQVSVVMDFIVDIASIVAAGAYARVSTTALWWLLPYLAWDGFTTTVKVWRLLLNA